MSGLTNAIVELYRKASTELPDDVVKAMKKALKKEKGTGLDNLKLILKNIELAKKKSVPMCQDTGSTNFYVKLPKNFKKEEVKNTIMQATKIATEKYYLRQNTVDTLTGRALKDNIGIENPHIEFEETGKKGKLVVDLLLKGGGSENVSRQYALPHRKLGAERNLEGVKKAVLNCVAEALGSGCPPGILGVCIGGARDTGYTHAKKQLLRKLDDKNPNPVLAKLEKELVEECNNLGIGPSGLGGKTTVLAVKACALARIPACYFVTISYTCWAMRRKKLVFGK